MKKIQTTSIVNGHRMVEPKVKPSFLQMSNSTAYPTTPAPERPKNVINGLGDVIEVITNTTGIKYIVNKLTKNKKSGGCGCNKRKNRLNRLMPLGNRNK